MTPPAILTLGFMPAPASLIGRGQWTFESHFSMANVFLMSGEVEQYLEDRHGRGPLTPADIQGILSESDGDLFYFDGEIGFANLAFHYGVSDRLQVFASLPYYTFGGGAFDESIMEFHDSFGLGQAGRNLVGMNQYQVLMRFDDQEFSMLDAPASGFGDPTFGLRHPLSIGGGSWTFAMEWAVKPSVADQTSFRSNGHLDAGVQMVAERHWNKSSLYLSGSYVWLGNFDQANFHPADIPSATLSFSRKVSDRTTVLLQGLISGSIFADETRSSLSSLEYQMSLGARYRLGTTIFSIAVTENLVNFQNTPDIGLFFGFYFGSGMQP